MLSRRHTRFRARNPIQVAADPHHDLLSCPTWHKRRRVTRWHTRIAIGWGSHGPQHCGEPHLGELRMQADLAGYNEGTGPGGRRRRPLWFIRKFCS